MSVIEMPAGAPELRRGDESLTVERRILSVPLLGVEFREPGAVDSGGDWFTLTGHAAVFDQTTTLYKGRTFQVTETIARGAFDEVLADSPDVHLNVNHDMSLVLARTGISGVGGLEVSTDPIGLRVYARISPRLSYAQDLAELMRTGVVDQMSFAFSIGNETFTNSTDEATGYETDHFQINQVSALYDCTVCAQGAYPTTDAVLHSRAIAAGRTIEVGRNRSIEPQAGAATAGQIVASHDAVGGDEAAAVRRRRVELARISARQHFPDPKEPQ